MYKSVFFEPWKGDNYEKEKNKILIIGHNYPCNESCAVCPDCGNRTIHEKCIKVGSQAWLKEYLDGEGDVQQRRTFTNFERSYYNKHDISKEESCTFWHKVAFYNYVQKASKSRIGYMNKSDYDMSLNAFYEVLNQLKPNHIIVWGKVYGFIPIEKTYQKFEIDKIEYIYSTIDKNVKMLKIHHPSMFYSWQKWGHVIECFLAM